ncbi:amidase [Cupriavidus sp. UGS-1]|uniref:amidase n=1 Tax=Cupriavidus sp. UGS-1 TaxID=2899826 RepID=UPI001E496103|nr:amidase [Cupriavidus sp. UGS-1]
MNRYPVPSVSSFPTLVRADDLTNWVRRVADQDRALHAWVRLAGEAALRDAGSLSGPLQGMPFGVKDVLDVAGMPTRCGSPASPDDPAPADADCVARLRAAGAVPIGKTVTAEFAHVTPGPTRNPANADHTPGGSSSGSAAAVAAGMVPFALGTQTGGSMIRPAAFCGVVGFKPTYSVLSRRGMRVMCPSLDVIGWHADTVDTAARVGAVLLPGADVDRRAALRFGFLPEPPGYRLEPAAANVLDHARRDLLERGHAMATVAPPASSARLLEAHGVLVAYEMARSLAAIATAADALLSPALHDTIRRGLSLSDADHAQARRLQESARNSWEHSFGDIDLVLTSSALGPAPAGLSHTGNSGFNKAWSVLGWPCLHLPVTVDAAGLPIGVLLVARPGADRQLLAWAGRLHAAIDRRRGVLPASRTAYSFLS